MIDKTQKKVFLYIFCFFLICQNIILVNALDHANEEKIIIKNLSDENFKLMLISYGVALLFIIFILYLIFSKILLFGKIFTSACKNKRILVLILAQNGEYELTYGKIITEKIHDTIRHHVIYKSHNQTIKLPLLSEHIIRPDNNIKKIFPDLLIVSGKYSVGADIIKKTEILNDIVSIKENNILKNALIKYYENNNFVLFIESKINDVERKIEECEKKCDEISTKIILRKNKIKDIIKEMYDITDKIKEINIEQESVMRSLIEENKYIENISKTGKIISRIYDTTPVKIDFDKFESTIATLISSFNLMKNAIQKTDVDRRKTAIIILAIILIIIFVGGFFIINNNALKIFT